MTKSIFSFSNGMLVVLAGGLLYAGTRRKSWVRAGQVAVITGGSRGLGLALAHRFGKAGLRLVLAAEHASELWNAQRELLAAGSVADEADVLLFAGDLSDRVQAAALIQGTLERFGAIDFLINNAGIIEVGPAENQPVEAYERAMAVDFFAALYTTYAALPHFLEKGKQGKRGAGIVNIASIGGKVAVPHMLPYVAAKFALAGFSEGLHAELWQRGVRVTTVCPGLMRTGGEVHAHFRGQVEKEKAWFHTAARTPLLSADVHHAAEQIFRAADQGRAEITITPQAWLAARLAGAAPELTQAVSGLVHAWLLPDPARS